MTKIKSRAYCIVLLVLVMVVIGSDVKAQRQKNFGERAPMTELPRSRVEIRPSTPEPQAPAETRLVPLGKGEYLLNAGWRLGDADRVIASPVSLFSTDFSTEGWYNAVVPGTVLTTLVEAGVYPDPFWGLNNLLVPDTLCRMDWWYRLEFDMPDMQHYSRAKLLFNGINYKAQVWLNGEKLGAINGAFTRGEFDATRALVRDGRNVLAVHILPPHNPGYAHEASMKNGQGGNGGQLCLDGPTFIASEGWDWVPTIRDRNIGLWQDVRLQLVNDVEIGDVQVVTDLPLPDTTYVDLTLKTRLKNSSDQPQKVDLTVEMERLKLKHSVTLAPGETRAVVLTPQEYPALRYASPELWWPNGYGAQHLYSMKLRADTDGAVSDEKTVRFGVREMEYEMSVDTPHKENLRIRLNPTAAHKDGDPLFDNVRRRDVANTHMSRVPMLLASLSTPGIEKIEDQTLSPFFVLRVNGVRIFLKGGNWGMDDGMKRVSCERLEPYFRLQRDQHFNMIRNWTGESTEEAFYALCDEYGLMVFNDFWLSTDDYNLEPNDHPLMFSNMVDAVRRFRNHPSIAVWCPRNEGVLLPAMEHRVADMLAKEDGTRYYIPSSIKLNSTDSGPWDYHEPDLFYTFFGRGFNTEAGSPSLPTAETVRRMMAPEDVWPIGDVWCYHDWHMGVWGNLGAFMDSYRNAIDSMFGPSDNVDDFCKKAQLVNYESYRAIFEAWNSRLWNNATGVLIWMSHPAWPSLVWQTYSWDKETPGAYFGSKKACEPLHVQFDYVGHFVRVVNQSRCDYGNLTAVAEVFDVQGRLLKQESRAANAPRNEAHAVFALDLKGMPDVVFVRVKLLDRRKRILAENFYWQWTGESERDFRVFNTLPDVRLTASASRCKSDGETVRGEVIVKNPGASVALTVKLNLRDAATDEAVLPTLFSDGYFTLMPGEEKRVNYEFAAADATPRMKITAEGYNIPRADLCEVGM